MKQPAVYITTNKPNGVLYTGVTSDLSSRDYKHKNNTYKSFTSKYNCDKLVYYEIYDDMENAILREKRLKAGSREKKVQLIEAINPNWDDLSDLPRHCEERDKAISSWHPPQEIAASAAPLRNDEMEYVDDGLIDGKPHYTGHRKRLRERFLKEPKLVPDYELLEILLFAATSRSDTKPMAKRLIARFGSFARVLSADMISLGKVEGINLAAIAAIKTVQEAASRMLLDEVKAQPVLNTWLKLLDYCRLEMGHLKNEQFRILFLNSKNMLIADEVQNTGTINHTAAYPREIVRRSLELAAASIILVHNHPSGDATPSPADIDLTNQIIAAAKPLEVKVHDHLIIAGGEHYSFKSSGLI